MIKDELILKEVEEKASLCIILTVLDFLNEDTQLEVSALEE